MFIMPRTDVEEMLAGYDRKWGMIVRTTDFSSAYEMLTAPTRHHAIVETLH
jgi:hypothetical protein